MSDLGRIEVFEPFGQAFDLTKKILFQPFDLTKWLVIGFAAWLATFFSGGGANYRRWWGNNNNWRWQSYHHGPVSNHIAFWVFPLGAIIFVFVVAVVALMLWLNARGRFMFIDCIVRNRAAIAAPWREYRVDANRFFVFQFVVALCGLVCVAIFACFWFLFSRHGGHLIALPLLVFFMVAWVLVAIVFGVVTHFMVPVMYRQRCDALAAFGTVWNLIVAHLGVFILFVLFNLVLYVAAAMIGCVIGCLTCCIAALPYVGTVILLPIVMTLYAFTLFFLRQFGDSYDVWAVVRPTEPPMPPVQEVLPPL
ncbi:MAG TPA: hypothetical protein VHW03_06895 [Chthoniobacterales bacterium]|nr:hypothetical protein [Chthoniobacterales bacterium]